MAFVLLKMAVLDKRVMLFITREKKRKKTIDFLPTAQVPAIIALTFDRYEESYVIQFHSFIHFVVWIKKIEEKGMMFQI